MRCGALAFGGKLKISSEPYHPSRTQIGHCPVNCSDVRNLEPCTILLFIASPRGAVLSYKQKYRTKQESYVASPHLFDL